MTLAGLTIMLAGVSMRAEITNLDRTDYRERIRNFEYDYGAVDAVSTASEAVDAVQQDVIRELEERYIGSGETRAYPFIVNGDGETILFLPESELSETVYGDVLAPRLTETTEPRGDFTIDNEAAAGWIAYSYYEPWDWYTGYFIHNDVRFAGVRRLVVKMALAVGGAALLLFALFSVILNRILRPVRPIGDALGAARDRDLSVSVPVFRRDELGAIADAVNSLIAQFREIINALKEDATTTVSTGERLDTFAANAEHTFRAIADGTTAMRDRMEQLYREIARSREGVTGIAGQTRDLKKHVELQERSVDAAGTALDAMDRAMETSVSNAREARDAAAALHSATQRSSASLEESDELMQATAQRAEAIHEFIGLIQGVAEQTGLLAMNAAIEAAHAGDAGRGFAVVADQIQKLSSEAEESAQNIEHVLKELSQSIQNASEISRRSKTDFNEFDTEIVRVNGALEEIATQGQHLQQRHREVSEAVGALTETSRATRRGIETAHTEAEAIQGALEAMDTASQTVKEQIDTIAGQTDTMDREISQVRTLISGVSSAARELESRVGQFVTGDEE